MDVFQAKKNAETNIKAKNNALTPEEARLVEKMMLAGKRAGLDLPEDKQEILKEKKKELSQACLEFSVRYMFCLSDAR